MVFYLDQTVRTAEAWHFLETRCARPSCGTEPCLLVGDLCLKMRKSREAFSTYQQALAQPDLPQEQRIFVERRLATLQSR